MKKKLLAVSILTSYSAFAAQIITLEDGRKVQLEDDFTWHYVVEETVNTEIKADQTAPPLPVSSAKKNPGVLSEKSATEEIVPKKIVTDKKVHPVATVNKPNPATTLTVPTVPSTPTIPVIPQENKRAGTTLRLADTKPTLQLSKSGADVLLGSAYYDNGEVVIPTSITNQSSRSIILVEVEVVLSDMAGTPLTSDTFDIWASIKRMPETYLRPAKATEGKAIRLAVNEAEEYQISAKISEVKTR